AWIEPAWGNVVGSLLAQRIGLALAIAVAVESAAAWTWRLLKPVVPETIPATAKVERSALDLKALAGANLFGPDADADRLPVESAADVPVSSLNVRLTGVIAAGRFSIALISVDEVAAKPFRVGAEVAPGAVLEAVFPNRINLRRAGRLEAVLLS